MFVRSTKALRECRAQVGLSYPADAQGEMQGFLADSMRQRALYMAVLLSFIAGSSPFLTLSRSPSVSHHLEKQYFFTVGAIFKNEAAIMHEWISHYLLEGADHIYLVDNGSDDEYETIVQPFIDRGQVTLMVNSKRHAQQEILHNYLLPLRLFSEWMLAVDLDEFMYARSGTIPGILQQVPEQVACIHVPWKMYGSSGHKQQPPGSVVKGFVRRNDSGFNKGRKAFFRSSATSEIHTHDAEIDGITVTLQIGHTCANESACIRAAQAKKLVDSTSLQLNHYAIQSLQWFVSTKMSRGDIASEHDENVRNFDYFTRYEDACNDIEDNDLYLKHKAFYDSLSTAK